MNFIRIGKSFIHLDEVKSITVNSVRESEITVSATFRDDTTTHIHLDSNYNRLDRPTITPVAVAMSIQDAIESLYEGNCENVDDYLEDNVDALEDTEDDTA